MSNASYFFKENSKSIYLGKKKKKKTLKKDFSFYLNNEFVTVHGRTTYIQQPQWRKHQHNYWLKLNKKRRYRWPDQAAAPMGGRADETRRLCLRLLIGFFDFKIPREDVLRLRNTQESPSQTNCLDPDPDDEASEKQFKKLNRAMSSLSFLFFLSLFVCKIEVDYVSMFRFFWWYL